MSGFGSGGDGGFGNPAPHLGGFPSAPFGGGFGSPAVPPPSGLSNNNNNTPFGGVVGFGGVSTLTAPTTFAAPLSFAAPTSFAAPASFVAPATTAFATPATFASFQQPVFGTSAPFGSNGFGTTSSGFGSSGFGTSSGFGISNNNNNIYNSTNNNNTPFGQQQHQEAEMDDVPNPFGGGGSSAPSSVSFGMSSNVVTSNTNTSAMHTFGGGGMAFTTPAPFENNSFSLPPANPFGAPASTAASGPFGAASSSMTFGGLQQQHNRHASTGSIEMGGPDSPTPMSAFGSTFHSTSAGAGIDSGSLSPIPEDTMEDPFYTVAGSSGNGGAAPQQQGCANSESDKLAELKAKIEAKKKKLQERTQKKDRHGIGSSNSIIDDGNSSPQPKQTRLKESNRSRIGRNRSASPLPSNDLTAEQQARAERNTARFSTSTNNAVTQAHLPTELQGKPNVKPFVTSAVGGEANREDLANAKSLVGTCMFMCPDEELLRRQRENDIQLLEIPDPGGIHPPDWTLRNTVVKRFRRSAADYKLDVPEWIRPPDVLERVCGYLEEWVMVSCGRGRFRSRRFLYLLSCPVSVRQLVVSSLF
jgi:SAC3/GANP family